MKWEITVKMVVESVGEEKAKSRENAWEMAQYILDNDLPEKLAAQVYSVASEPMNEGER